MKIYSGNKYHAVKIKEKGKTFDSKKEARRYSDLLLLQKAGEIKELECQRTFIIQPEFQFENNGKLEKVRAITYVADFVYIEKGKLTLTIEDAKGIQTDVFKLKWKMMKYNNPYYDYVIT